MRVLVILGAAVWEGGVPSPTLRRRTAAAAQRWRSGDYDRIAPSGGLGRHGPTEAEVMRDLLLSAGVPQGAILLEDQAQNTVETAWRIAKLLAPEDRVTAVTDLTHLARTWLAFRATGRHVRMANASMTEPRQSWAQILRQGAREMLGLPYYALRLTLDRTWRRPNP